MRKVLMMLMAAVVACAAGKAIAVDLCPIYLYGQWNGVFYYYCTPQGMCMNGTPQPGQSATPKKPGCSGMNCLDTPIRPAVLNVKTGNIHITKVDQLKKKVKNRKNGGQPGEGDDADSNFNIKDPNASFLTETDAYKSDRAVFVKAKDMNGNDQTFYFRVLDLQLKRPEDGAKSIPSFVGQQLDKVPKTVEELTYVGSDGVYDHIIQSKDGKKHYQVVSSDEIQKP